ncbi:MAG: putative PurR-regulated permease PerM, partial [Candidatus Azotimanducaceae bacterium]
MISNRIVEYVFFFGLLGAVSYLVWEMFSPFVSALALAAIIVTVSYPLHQRIVPKMPRQNETLSAFVSTLLVFITVILPLLFITSVLAKEAVSVYGIIGSGQVGFEETLLMLEGMVNNYIPGFEIDFTAYLKQAAEFLIGNVGAIFASTASTIFLFFIAMIASFYLFRDGKEFTRKLVVISPLPDDQDDVILARLAQSLRSVLSGTLLVALIQGTLTAIGLWLFGFERAVMWGTIASFGALIPGVGTTIVFIPAILYLIFSGAYGSAAGLAVWGVLAVGL